MSPNRKYRFEATEKDPLTPCNVGYLHDGCEVKIYDNQNDRLILSKKAIVAIDWYDDESIVLQEKFGDDGNIRDEFMRLWIHTGKITAIWIYQSYYFDSGDFSDTYDERYFTPRTQICESICNSVAYKKERCYSFVQAETNPETNEEAIEIYQGNKCLQIGQSYWMSKRKPPPPSKYLRSFFFKNKISYIGRAKNYQKYKQGIFFTLKDTQYQILENHKIVQIRKSYEFQK
ncbi:MAG: hypothetical protein AAF518_06505 [Spirochaetota bacterium]